MPILKIEIRNSEKDIRERYKDELEGYKILEKDNINILHPNDFIKYVHIYYPIKLKEGRFDSITEDKLIKIRGIRSNYKWNIKSRNHMIFYMRNKDKNFKDLVDMINQQENNRNK